MLMAGAIIPLYLQRWARLNKCILSAVALPPRQVLTAFPPRTLQEIISPSIAALHGRPPGPSRVKHLYSRSPLPSLLLSLENPYPFRKWPTVVRNSAELLQHTKTHLVDLEHSLQCQMSTIWLNIPRMQGVLHWSNVNVQLTESLTNRVELINESSRVLFLQNWWPFISTHCLLDG